MMIKAIALKPILLDNGKRILDPAIENPVFETTPQRLESLASIGAAKAYDIAEIPEFIADQDNAEAETSDAETMPIAEPDSIDCEDSERQKSKRRSRR